MKRVVVLGCSLAGLTAIEKIKEKSREYSFTIISFDGTYPVYRQRYSQFINKEIKSDDLNVKNREYFESCGIDVILDKKINRINFNRKKIFADDKEQIDYDILLICDFPAEKWPEIKGTNKSGIYSMNKTKNILDCFELMPIIDHVVIESDRLSGFLMALACLSYGKHVALVTGKPWLLPSRFPKNLSEALIDHLEDKGLNIYTSSEIVELLGESDVKAVRLKSGKILASDATFMADVLPDPKLLKGTNIAMAERISVDQSNRSNLDDVFALDLACIGPGTSKGKFKNAKTLITEGCAVASTILGEEIQPEAGFAKYEVNTEALSVCVYGKSYLGSDSKEIFDTQTFSYKRIVYHQGKPCGVVLINEREKCALFEKFLNEEVGWEQIEGEFVSEPKAEEPTEEAERDSFVGDEESLEAVDTIPSQQELEDQQVKDSQACQG